MSKQRCHWVDLNDPLYIEYHDKEWGVPVHDDRTLFEFLILEGAQAGLSWKTILQRREGYREVFKNFDPKKVAKMDPEPLFDDERIIRNKLKIKSAITNAQVFLDIQKEFGSFDTYLWEWGNDAKGISKDLKKRGMSFVGETIIYAYLQAVGVVNDHEKGCFKG
ncbi:DNA-3-methyladenine glycosylase I [Candidatus Kaiserbacteria bacterium]|nr:DNA-3-methyladenine glycosylase I [Candidatus Kaiserbacteria bacterium]